MKRLTSEQMRRMSRATLEKTSAIGLAHAEQNAPLIERTIADLRREARSAGARPAVVVSAGPSLHRTGSIARIMASGFRGHVVCVDGSLAHCLRQGLVPDYVVTVDPHCAHRMVRWFGDPRLEERPADDYFRRQDLDVALNRDEKRRNEETIALVDRYGPRIKAVIATSANPEVAQRCLDAGMSLYWWNPLYDDFQDPDGLSRRVYGLNKVPCMVTGGNVGASAWVLAHAVLQAPDVVVVGMDNGYPPGTSAYNTQYYEYLQEAFPDDPEQGLLDIYNPHLDEVWRTDPAYCWYNDVFLEMARVADCRTHNCTEGGILFGPGIDFVPLEEGLRRCVNVD